MSSYNNRLALITGVDIPIPEFQLVLHQPTIKEISMIGEEAFFSGAQMLCFDQQSMLPTADQALQISDFAILLESVKQRPNQKILITNVLKIFFPAYDVLFTPRSIILKRESVLITIDEDSFIQFKNLFSTVLCLRARNEAAFNPQGAKAQEIAKKLERARQRVAAQKQQDQRVSLDQYVSSLVIAVQSMSLFDVIELTLYQLYDLLERYGLYSGYDLDIRARLAGSTDNKEIENWMKSIH